MDGDDPDADRFRSETGPDIAPADDDTGGTASSFAHDAVFQFTYDDEQVATVVEQSVRLEVGEIDDERSRARVGRDGPVVELVVEASDFVALRAGVNTWTRLVGVAEEMVDVAASSGVDR